MQVVGEFYRRAADAGIDLTLGYKATARNGRRCRFSAVITRGDEIVAIVACKRSRNAARRMTARRHRYESFGVPVIWVRGMDRVPAAVDAAKRLLEQDAVDPLKEFE